MPSRTTNSKHLKFESEMKVFGCPVTADDYIPNLQFHHHSKCGRKFKFGTLEEALEYQPYWIGPYLGFPLHHSVHKILTLNTLDFERKFEVTEDELCRLYLKKYYKTYVFMPWTTDEQLAIEVRLNFKIGGV